VTPSATLRDWIPANEITVLQGEFGTGKTSIVEFLAKDWAGPTFYFTADSVLERDSRRWFREGVAYCQITDTEDLMKMVRTLVDERVGRSSLIIIDGLDLLSSKVRDELGAAARMCHKTLQVLRGMQSTVVLTGLVRHMAPVKRMGSGTNMPESVTHSASTILELESIARNTEGVIVEVIAKKDRRRPQGSRGRLWVRPQHQTPVRTT